MKKKASHLLFVFFLIFALSLQARERQEPKWKGKIKRESGIKIISNPGQPVFGEIKFELEEDLVLGREKNEDDIFSRPVYIQVDADGNIYVNDIRERRIRKITSGGQYLKDIGRRGQGPGEFQGPRKLWIDDRTGDLYIVDFLKIIVFDKEGINRKNIRLQRLSLDIYADSDGNLWSNSFAKTESGESQIFEKISPQGKMLKEIVNFPEVAKTVIVGKSETAVTVVSRKHGYEYKLFVSNIDNKSFVYGYSRDYELNKIDKNGNLLCKIRVEDPAQRFTRKEKSKVMSKFKRGSKAVRDAVQLPKTKPFFEAIFSDSEGRIYVERVKSPLDESKEFHYDIFSPEGYFLYKTTFPYKPQVIKRGYFYMYDLDEEMEVWLVKRFKIKNWEQIQKEL